MAVMGENILSAMKTRLEKITVANGYPFDIKSVVVYNNEMNIEKVESKLPYIELVQGQEVYEHETCGHLNRITQILIRIVASPKKDDLFMEQFKSAVVRCIYGDSWTASGNSGIQLTNGVTYPKLVSSVPDYGMIKSNRIYAILFEINSKSQTWNFEKKEL